MNAAKRKPESVPSGATAGVWQRPFRRGFTVLLLLAGLTGGAYYGWQRVGPQVTQGPEYVLELEQIVITPPPPWIRADVRAETVRDGGLRRSQSYSTSSKSPQRSQATRTSATP
jgi:hypothetical protein